MIWEAKYKAYISIYVGYLLEGFIRHTRLRLSLHAIVVGGRGMVFVVVL